METKKGIETRVKVSGKWPEYYARREALRAQGIVGIPAREILGLEFPPQPVKRVQESLSARVEYQEESGETSALAMLTLPRSRSEGKAVVDFVARYVGRAEETIPAGECPSRAALAMLRWVNGSPVAASEFWKTIWPKFNAPSKADEAVAEKFRDRGQPVLDLIEECRRWAREAETSTSIP